MSTFLQIFDGASPADRVTLVHDGCNGDGCRLGISFPSSDAEAVAAAQQVTSFGDLLRLVAALIARSPNRVQVRVRSASEYYAGRPGDGPDLIYIAASRDEARHIRQTCPPDAISVQLFTDEAQLPQHRKVA